MPKRLRKSRRTSTTIPNGNDVFPRTVFFPARTNLPWKQHRTRTKFFPTQTNFFSARTDFFFPRTGSTRFTAVLYLSRGQSSFKRVQIPLSLQTPADSQSAVFPPQKPQKMKICTASNFWQKMSFPQKLWKCLKLIVESCGKLGKKIFSPHFPHFFHNAMWKTFRCAATG